MSKPYISRDKLAKKAQFEGYRARSVYKLMELDQEYRLLRPGMKVLDLGAAPGSWLQYVSEKISPADLAIGLDIQPIAAISPNIQTKVCDILIAEAVENCLQDFGAGSFDLIISDLAPNTSGIKYVDQQKSLELDEKVSQIAKRYLKSDGVLVMKIFQSPKLPLFINKLKTLFKKVSLTKVQASRDRSSEHYLICQNKI